MPGEESRNAAMFEQPSPKQSWWSKLTSKIAPQALPTTYVKVFDAYRGQGDIDFAKAKAAGYEMVILKASEGLYEDTMFQTNWQKALDVGMLVGAYHFYRSNMTGTDQAQFHITVTTKLRDAINYRLASALDLETADGKENAVRKTQIPVYWNIIKDYALPGIYSSRNYWQTLMDNMTLPSNIWAWVAAWTSATAPLLPIGWTEAQTKFWQYGVYDQHSWALPVPGVVPPTHVDVDRWFGTLDQLKSFLTVPIPPPTPTPSNTVLPTAKYVPIENSLASRVSKFNGTDNEIFDWYPTGSNDDVGKRIHITAPVEVLIEPKYTGDGGYKGYLIVDTALLAKYKPTCPIYADATKGHLQVP
jgi:GH25 family lysozyme M1 (1,4-beta-N-acetylmuramidase)